MDSKPLANSKANKSNVDLTFAYNHSKEIKRSYQFSRRIILL